MKTATSTLLNGARAGLFPEKLLPTNMSCSTEEQLFSPMKASYAVIENTSVLGCPFLQNDNMNEIFKESHPCQNCIKMHFMMPTVVIFMVSQTYRGPRKSFLPIYKFNRFK